VENKTNNSNRIKITTIIAIAGALRNDGVIFTVEALRRLADEDDRFEYHEHTGRLLSTGYFDRDEILGDAW